MDRSVSGLSDLLLGSARPVRNLYPPSPSPRLDRHPFRSGLRSAHREAHLEQPLAIWSIVQLDKFEILRFRDPRMWDERKSPSSTVEVARMYAAIAAAGAVLFYLPPDSPGYCSMRCSLPS
jgi:hypothetical protein